MKTKEQQDAIKWQEWKEEIITLSVRDGWDLLGAEGNARAISELHDQGISAEEAYGKLCRNEV